MERCPDFARGPPGRGGEGEEGFAFAVSLGMKPNMGRLGISGAAFYPVRLNLEIISPSGLVLGSVGFEQRKHEGERAQFRIITRARRCFKSGQRDVHILGRPLSLGPYENELRTVGEGFLSKSTK